MTNLKRLLPLLVIIGALGAFFALGGAEALSLDALTARHAELEAFVADNRVAAVAGFIALYAILVGISFPGASALTVIGGLVFGTVVGGASVVVGATAGATIIFLATRTALGETLRARAGPFLKRLQTGFDANAFSYLLTLRLIPAVPFWALNIAAGVFGMRTAPYVTATALGIIPGTFVYASVGAGAGVVIAEGGELELSGLLLKPEVLLPILGLVALALLPVAVKRLRRAPLAPPEA
jgi:uncharacterized membrane protein YdjX (TVP38/TMEM64 family)